MQYRSALYLRLKLLLWIPCSQLSCFHFLCNVPFRRFVYKANSCLFCLLFKGFLTTMSINSLPVVHVTEYSKHIDSSFFQFQLVDLLATCIWESSFFTHLPAFCYYNKYPRQTYLKRGKLPFGSQLDKFLSPC